MKSLKSIKTLILIILSVTLGFTSCKNDLDEIRALTNEEELPDVTVIDLRSEYSVNEYTQARLISPLAYRFTKNNKQYSLFPDGINLMFFDKYKKLHSSLKADYGIYYEDEDYAKAKGNVILTNLEGSVLKTEELYVDEKNGKIYSVVPVEIVQTDGLELTGSGGFESNLDFTVYRFTDVSGKIIKEDEDDFMTGGESESHPKNRPEVENNKPRK